MAKSDLHCVSVCVDGLVLKKNLKKSFQVGTIISGSQNEERLTVINSRYRLFTISLVR
jgi:hypothetical protein